jgi:hypothetical protein
MGALLGAVAAVALLAGIVPAILVRRTRRRRTLPRLGEAEPTAPAPQATLP